MLSIICTFAFSGYIAADHLAGHSVEERTKPSGKVYKEGDDVPVAKPVVAVSTGGTRSGEEIYKASCATCHASGLAGAPVLGDAAGWKDRVANGNETLFQNAIKGFNAMPPMGMCTDCSEDEIKATVNYMLDNL